jgi:hypothetical protein
MAYDNGMNRRHKWTSLNIACHKPTTSVIQASAGLDPPREARVNAWRKSPTDQPRPCPVLAAACSRPAVPAASALPRGVRCLCGMAHALWRRLRPQTLPICSSPRRLGAFAAGGGIWPALRLGRVAPPRPERARAHRPMLPCHTRPEAAQRESAKAERNQAEPGGTR